ncbi:MULTISPECIES: peptidoglycan DD-metalloendopeptidase family protein [unclassified Pseudofrankia]|uniref:peptidoglycan DD-metalloendopeptidase family protein n=1 Tax=unclassified Pseudofrankia TaxID=2994372 RepID=UPI0008D9AB85|nr:MULTISPECIES: peptidoglycan DD-metalloendopeptidase family protein [unclassified Pseudofrankia]MDT3443798.1 M23 family metallopeptidase [Pseudofrankia sp. BMG5.37]OHV49991.1 hypothetical protein BCD48_11670 [Pseudofrankia sp. BMG5.36]
MAPAPSHDPRIPPLVAAAFLAAVLALGGWPRPATAGQITADRPAAVAERLAAAPRLSSVASPDSGGSAPRPTVVERQPSVAATADGLATAGRRVTSQAGGRKTDGASPTASPARSDSGLGPVPDGQRTVGPVPGGTPPGSGLVPQGRAVPAAAVRWRAPLDGSLTVARPFQPPATPYGAGHRGIDLRTRAGAMVRAAGDGVVSYAGVLAGRGVVAVTHGELRTTYEPLDVLVSAGQRVTAGTPLGRLATGHPGCSQDACLHWGLLRGAAYLSPLVLLLPDPPRLLPVARPIPVTSLGMGAG